MIVCPKCNGNGIVSLGEGIKGIQKCPVCHGKGKLNIEARNYGALIRGMDDDELAQFLTKLCVVYRNVDGIENVGDAAVEAMSKEVYDYIIVSSKLKEWLKSEIKPIKKEEEAK